MCPQSSQRLSVSYEHGIGLSTPWCVHSLVSVCLSAMSMGLVSPLLAVVDILVSVCLSAMSMGLASPLLGVLHAVSMAAEVLDSVSIEQKQS